MHIRGIVQSTETTELTASADDAPSARAAIEAQIPDGYELLQITNTMSPRGAVVATGRIRHSATRELEAEGTDYPTARDALHAAVPQGWRLLYVLTIEG